MPYKRKGRQSYSRQQRQPTTRRPWSGPSAWTDGFTKAIEQAEKLSKEGWTVDTGEGALTPEEADQFVKEAKKKGFETQKIPVAELDGEAIAHFVAIRQVGQAGAADQPDQTTTGVPDDLPVDAVEAQFLQLFYSGLPPSDDAVDNGFIMTSDKTVAFIRRDAEPASNVAGVVDSARDNLKQPNGVLDTESAQALIFAKQNNKDVVAFGAQGQEVYVDIKKFAQGLMSLGDSQDRVKVNIATKDTADPIAISNSAGDMMIFSPVILEGKPDSKIITYNQALTAYRNRGKTP